MLGDGKTKAKHAIKNPGMPVKRSEIEPTKRSRETGEAPGFREALSMTAFSFSMVLQRIIFILITIICSPALIFGAYSPAEFTKQDLEVPLSETIIRDLYVDFMRGQQGGYEYHEGLVIDFSEGSFSSIGATEAIVRVGDHWLSHAAGWSRIFYLRFEKNWKIELMLTVGDYSDYKIVDVDVDGVSEVWITRGGGNQGYFYNEGELVSLTGGEKKVLYTNDGFDYRGAMADKDGITAHINITSFEDVDLVEGLEIVNVEIDCLKDGMDAKVRVYVFKDGAFKEEPLGEQASQATGSTEGGPSETAPKREGTFEGLFELNTSNWDYEPWLSKVKQKLFNIWIPLVRESLEFSSGKDGETIWQVVVNKDGTIKKLSITKSSSSNKYDLAAKQAVEAPFPEMNTPFPPLSADFPLENLVVIVHFMVSAD